MGEKMSGSYFSELYIQKYLSLNDEATMDRRLSKLEAEVILDEIPAKAPVLAMGLGHGSEIELLLDRFESCEVVEFSPLLCKLAKSKHGARLVVHQDNFETFTPQAKYETIMATAVLHHVLDPATVIRQATKWLKPGGNLLVTVPNAYSVHRALGQMLGLVRSVRNLSETAKESGVRHTFSPEDLKTLLEDSGLKVIRQLRTFVKFTSYQEMTALSDRDLKELFEVAKIVAPEFHATIAYLCTVQDDLE